MRRYIFLDTETGGIGLDKSLLSIGYIITDDNFNTLYSSEVFLKPNDGIYHVTAEAMSINKIDLIKHDAVAITYNNFAKDLFNLLLKASGGRKLVVVGKNVHGDLAHIWDKVLKRPTWEQFCSYQIVDLTAVWKFLELTRKVPALPKTSLNNLAEYLQIDTSDIILHQALGDAELTIRCFKAITERFQ